MFAVLASIGVFLAIPPSLPNAKALSAKLEARYRNTHTLAADFLERFSENGQVARSEAGTAFFRRPGKMRWEYESPEKNVFVIDGKTAWFYVPADHTVTRARAKESRDWRTPLALLAGEMKLSRICAHVGESAAVKPRTVSNVVLHCQLKGSEDQRANAVASDLGETSDEESVFLEIVPESGELARVLVREGGGIEVEFRFANWRYDPPVADSAFRFEVPRGVAIVNGEMPREAKP